MREPGSSSTWTWACTSLAVMESAGTARSAWRKLTVRPNGTLAPIRNYQSLGTIEVFTNKLDVYMYVGDEYEARAAVWHISPRTRSVTVRPSSTTAAAGQSLCPARQHRPQQALAEQPGSFRAASATAPTTPSTRWKAPSASGIASTGDRKGTLQFGMQESYFLRYDWNGRGQYDRSRHQRRAARHRQHGIHLVPLRILPYRN